MLLRIEGKEECPVCDQRNELRKISRSGLSKSRADIPVEGMGRGGLEMMFQHKSNRTQRKLDTDSKKDLETTLVFSLSYYMTLLIETKSQKW